MADQEQQISEFKSRHGLKRIFAAFFYSLEGLANACRSEHAFRQELVLVAIGTVVALLLPLPVLHRIVLIAVLVQVLVIELINSSIEAVVDRVSLERHPLSKNAKDFGSAAVLLTLLIAASVWAAILAPLFH